MKRLAAASVLWLFVAGYAIAGTIAKPFTFSSGQVISSTQVNSNFDTIYNEFNGSITNPNINAAAAISFSKIETPDPEDIDDYSADATEQLDNTTPGTNLTPVLATSLREEIKQLRYAIQRLAGNKGTMRRDADAANEDVGWIEEAYRGENLITNSNFAVVDTTLTPNMPVGFFESGVISSSTFTAAGVNGFGYVWGVTAAGSTDSWYYVLKNVKKSTKYLVAINGLVASGTPRIFTLGADATSEWRDMSMDMSGSSYAWYTGIVQTDSTPTDLEIAVEGSGGGYTATFRHIGVYEIGDHPIPIAKIYDVETASSAGPFNCSAGSGKTAVTSMSVTVTLPDYGYVVKVTVDGEVADASGGTLDLEIDADASTIDPILTHTSVSALGDYIPYSLTRVVTNLASGNHTMALYCTATTSTYTMKSMSMVAEVIPTY